MPSCVGIEGPWHAVRIAEVCPAEFGLARIDALGDELATESADPILLVWRSQRALLVTREDTRLPSFRETCSAMTAAGWPIVMRRSGGGPCPVGPGTVQVAVIETAGPGVTMNVKYDALTRFIQSALRSLGINARTGLVAGAYCPGRYDLSVDGMKIAGMSQHWFRNRGGIRCVVTSACINVEEAPDMLAGVVDRFYSRVGSRLRCQATALTSVQLCQGQMLVESSDLVATVMNEFARCADRRDENSSTHFHSDTGAATTVFASQNN